MSEFKDCEYRFVDENDELCCMNDVLCDNCVENVHLNCQNYVPEKDMCLLGFSDVSDEYDKCLKRRLKE